MLALEGDEAMEETEVAGEGGLVSGSLMVSPVVTTLGGFLALCDILRP